jgi:hypothetical protein
MTIVCPECGSVNKKGNKFCFECGMRLPAEKFRPGLDADNERPRPSTASDAKLKHLKKRWVNGEITAEEYRGHLLRLKLKERFGSHIAERASEGAEGKEGNGQEAKD